MPRCVRQTARRSATPGRASSRTGTPRAFTSFGDGHGVWETVRRQAAAVLRAQLPHGDAVVAAGRAARSDADHAQAAARRGTAPRTAVQRGAGLGGPGAAAERHSRSDSVARPRSRRRARRRARPGWCGRPCRTARPIERAARANGTASATSRDARPGHEPRAVGQGQPAEHAGLRHPSRQRRAGAGGARSRSSTARTAPCGPARPTATASRSRRRRRPARRATLVALRVRRHRREGRRCRVCRQRLERRHHAVELRRFLRPRSGGADAARHGLHRPRRLPPRRRGHGSRRSSAQHAAGHPAAAGRHRGVRSPSTMRRIGSWTSAP